MFEGDEYEDPQRTLHPEIQPARIRIQDYKKKGFGKKLQEHVDKVKQHDLDMLRMKNKSEQEGN